MQQRHGSGVKNKIDANKWKNIYLCTCKPNIQKEIKIINHKKITKKIK